MKIKAYGKVNISLDVVGKREDGYHLLSMIMQNIDLYDEIEVEKQECGIILECNKSYVPVDNRNLAYKAAEIFKERYDIVDGVKINIEKNIPVSAGLAGGSTDAAAVLKVMNKLFNVNATEEELMELGLKLGADIPYCIHGGTALCEGIGEIITPIKPFRDKVDSILKRSDDNGEYITIIIEEKPHNINMFFPYFEESTMYQGMEIGKYYTLEELEL